MTISFIMFVHLSVLKEPKVVPIERIFIKFDISSIFENLSIKFEFRKNLTRK